MVGDGEIQSSHIPHQRFYYAHHLKQHRLTLTPALRCLLCPLSCSNNSLASEVDLKRHSTWPNQIWPSCSNSANAWWRAVPDPGLSSYNATLYQILDGSLRGILDALIVAHWHRYNSQASRDDVPQHHCQLTLLDPTSLEANCAIFVLVQTVLSCTDIVRCLNFLLEFNTIPICRSAFSH
jgi:hypothetical protein